MSTVKVNIKFTQVPVKGWKETMKRAQHIFDRMRLRGVSISEIKDAVQKGAKMLRKDGSIISAYRWLKVVYREFKFKNAKKIYPITVHEK